MSKRILSLVLTLALVLGSFSMAFADHADTTLTPQQKIDRLVEMGFVKGKDASGSDLDLQSPIKRSETSAIVSRALLSGGDKSMEAVEAEIERSRYSSRFTDVSLNSWYNPYVNVSVQEGIVEGYPNGEFRPERDIKYSEVITMMVRVLGEQPTPGVKYPDNYIGKARELGILDDIKVDYVGQAQRQGVFELLYNTLTSKGIGNYNIDKVLVLENNRVESIGANEIVVEVIKEVQRANFVDGSRNEADKEARRGQQLRITVDNAKVGEVEDLLGKVIDLTYDKTNKAVAVKLDNTYEYVSGEISLDSKSVKVDGRTYTVLKDEQYKNNDERIFNTYVNNEAFTYDAAYKKFTKGLDFGRVTIKNGKVLFIDGFEFQDIAPIKEVKNDGKEIIVYNDVNDGGEKRIELDDKVQVISFENRTFHKMDKKDIAKLDVIHVGVDTKGNKAVVVREDAQVNGTYDKVVEYTDRTVVVVDGKEYKILDLEAKRPVYSANSKDFYTLRSSQASNVLKGFNKEKVTVLRDVNGDLQYIGGEIEFGEFVGLLERVVGREARVLKSDNSTTDYTATLDSQFDNIPGTTGHQNLQQFNRGDLVFVSANKADIDKMTLLSKYNEILKTASVDKDLRYVTVDGKPYRVFDRTNVFVRNTKADGSIELFATSIANVQKYAGANLQAKVITDETYAKEVDSRYVYNPSNNIAHTIVFSDVSIKKESNTKFAEITSISNKYEEVGVKYADGTTETFAINTSTDAYKVLRNRDVVVGDIVELSLDKNNAKSLLDISTRADNIIKVNAAGKIVKSYDSRNRVLTLVGDNTKYYLTDETANFIKGSIEEDKTSVAVVFETIPNTDGAEAFVKAIAERTSTAPVKGKGILKDVLKGENGKVILKVNDGTTIEKLYQFIGNANDVIRVEGFKGTEIDFDLQTLNNVEYAFNVRQLTTSISPEAQTVMNQISALTPVSNLTLADEAKVIAAKNAYNALTTAQKAEVTNASILNDAEARIAALKGETTITAANIEETKNVGFGMFGVKINLPAGVSSAKIVKVDANAQDVTINNGSYTTVAGEHNPGNNQFTIEFVADGTTKTVTVTK